MPDHLGRVRDFKQQPQHFSTGDWPRGRVRIGRITRLQLRAPSASQAGP